MPNLQRPLVLVHGLWNTPKLFNRFKSCIAQPKSLLVLPHLKHKFGRVDIRELAHNLNFQINQRLGTDIKIDLLGFSMGGLISRVWLQEMDGYKRTERFFSVGSPHQGTLTAQLVPSVLFPGIAQMKVGSQLIKSLSINSGNLHQIECRSYFCMLDLMVFPGFRAVLPIGTSIPVPVLTHKCLIKRPQSINLIKRDLFSISSETRLSD